MKLLTKLYHKIKNFHRSDFEESVKAGVRRLKDNGTVPPADWPAFEAGVAFALSQYREDRKNTRLLMTNVKNDYLALYSFIEHKIETSSPNDSLVYVDIIMRLEGRLDAMISALE